MIELRELIFFATEVMFRSGTDAAFSLRFAITAVLFFTLSYATFADFVLTKPLFNPSGILRGLIPILPDYSDGNLMVFGIAKLPLSLVFSLQIFFKVFLLGTFPRASGLINVLIILNWLCGLYFISGWAWVVSNCPPWEAFCN